MLPAYRPDQFETLYHREAGPDLWAFMQDPETVLRMEVASYLCRPAVEPLSPTLLARFGQTVRRKEIKQMIGHMARQVLEHRGYQLDRSGVKIRKPGNIFYSGSKYRSRATPE